MSDTYLPAPGEPLPKEELSIPKALEFASTLFSGSSPFVWFIECRYLSQDRLAEVIVFDVEVELGQRKRYDIHRFEHIAVIFDHADTTYPEVLALRNDFPCVPHLNLREDEYPRSICLYEKPYSELKLQWTATALLDRIREWLALTAKGKLHAEDQPLEPLLIGSPWPLVIPFDIFTKLDGNSTPEPLMIHAVDGGNRRRVLIAEQERTDVNKQHSIEFIALVLEGTPQPHGIIHKQPATIAELHEFLRAASIDLLQEMRHRLQTWQRNGNIEDLRNEQLIVIVALPKTRETATETETTDLWAFLCAKPIADIGEEIGIWQFHDGQLGALVPFDQKRQGNQVTVVLLNPMYSFSRESAARLNGVTNQERRNVAAIGLGALGSQVFLNLMRAGFGEWVLIDQDYLLPHNLARHGLFGSDVGYAKAEMLLWHANHTIKGTPIARAIVADVLNPGVQAAEIASAFDDADMILDTSASVAVARYLARDVTSSARRVSLFLNSSGTDVVVLGEDLQRKIPLDLLEMQYYRSLIQEPTLPKYLRQTSNQVRYAQSCRDLSSDIPQDLVALHAAIGSRALRILASDVNASIAIWQTDGTDLSTKCIRVDPSEVIEQRFDDWTLLTDQYLLDKIWQMRMEKLPNETGGVLIGSFDMQRKMVYVVDVLPSPPDSTEWPNLYIRGCKGLSERVGEVKRVTAEMLDYVGEWHSHPRNCGCSPSRDDRKAFTWLARKMSMEGFPALMMIVGDHKQYCWHLKQMP